ncbi:MAG: hypothetical protein EOM20_15170 [Spartobacteria bacterium]|nr:hypothetical protein [Spartobacteria bacterium]
MNWFKKKYNVYVLCTANITRSPYFAAVLQQCVKRQERDTSCRICVYSCGTHAVRGRPIDEGIRLIASRNGLNLGRHASTPFTSLEAQQADIVLVMDDVQKNDVLVKYPELGGRVYAILEYASNGRRLASTDIMDPTGREPDLYRRFCRLADEEATRISRALIESLSDA